MSILQSIKNLFTGNKPMGPQQRPQNNPLTKRLLPKANPLTERLLPKANPLTERLLPSSQPRQFPRTQPTSFVAQVANTVQGAKQLFQAADKEIRQQREQAGGFVRNFPTEAKETAVSMGKGLFNMVGRVYQGITNNRNEFLNKQFEDTSRRLQLPSRPQLPVTPQRDIFTPTSARDQVGMMGGQMASYLVPAAAAARLTAGASLPARIGTQFAADLGTDALAFGEITPTGVGASLFGALAEAALPGRVPSVQNLQVPTRAPVPTRPQVTPPARPPALETSIPAPAVSQTPGMQFIRGAEPDSMADFIVGPRAEYEAMARQAQELQERIAKRARQQPFVPASKAGKESASKGTEGIIGRLRIESGFAAQQVGKAQRAGSISVEAADDLALKIPREQAQVVETFIDLFEPRLFDDVSLGIEIRGGSQGLYEYSSNTVTLFRENVMNSGGNFDRVFIHEMWHGMSRYLPEDMTRKVSSDYLKEVQSYIKNDKLLQRLYDPKTQEITNTIKKTEYEQLVKEMPEAKDRFTPVMKDGEIQYQRVMEPEEYRYTNIDEWFAETLTDASNKKLQNMSQASKSVFAHAKAVFADMINAIARVFGKDRAGKILDDFIANKYQDPVRRGNLRNNLTPSKLEDMKAKGVDESDLAATTPALQEGLKFSDKLDRALENAGARIDRLAKDLPVEISPVSEKTLAIGKSSNVQDKAIQKYEETIQTKFNQETINQGKELAEARTKLERFNKKGIGEKKEIEDAKKANELLKGTEAEKSAKSLQDYSKETRGRLIESKLVNEKQIEGLMDYDQHVNLFRKFDDTDSIPTGTGGKGVVGSGLKRAKGSDLETTDIGGNLLQARIQIEKRILQNDVLRSLADFANKLDEASPGQTVVKVESPSVIGKSFNEDTAIFDLKFNDWRYVPFVNEKGQTKLLKFSDKTEADFFKTLRQQGLISNSDEFDKGLKMLGNLTNWYGRNFTLFDPEFPILSSVMDLEEIFLKQVADGKSIKDATKVVVKSPFGFKAVTDFILKRDTPAAKIYSDLVDEGGASGSFSSNFAKDSDELIKNLESKDPKIVKKAFNALGKKLGQWNIMWENSAKVNLYKQGLDQGLTSKQAAAYAKRTALDYDINGYLGKIVKPFTIFGNTTLKGLNRGFRILTNPKALAVLTPSLLTAIVGAREWNEFVDPEGKVEISNWDKANSVPLIIPFLENFYVNLPVAHSFRPLKYLVQTGVDAMYGEPIDPGKRTKDFILSLKNNFAPSTGTIADPILSIATNKTFSGSKVRPGYEEGSQDYFDSLREDTLGRALIWATDSLDTATKGGINISPANINELYNSFGTPAKLLRQAIDIPRSIIEDGDIKGYPSRIFKSLDYDVKDSDEKNSKILKQVKAEARASEIKVKNAVEKRLKADKKPELKTEVQTTVDGMTEKEYESYQEKLRESKLNRLVERRLKADKKPELKVEVQAEVDALTDKQYETYLKMVRRERLNKEESALKNASVTVRAEYILQQRNLAKENDNKEEYEAMWDRLEAAGILTEAVNDYILEQI